MLKKTIRIITIESLILLITTTVFALPQITSISPQTQEPGGSITISGDSLGFAPGYVKIAGLRVEADTWGSTSINLTIPEGASSGNLYVVDSIGQESSPYQYTIDYISRTHPSNSQISNPDEFNLKDIGSFGSVNRIEARGDFIYAHYSTGVATYDASVSPPLQKSNFYLPSKMRDWKIFDDYIFMAGEFGLRIYKLSEMETGIPAKPNLYGGYTGIMFGYVAIQNYAPDKGIRFNGQPFSGTLIAASEFCDPQGSPRIFFFKWDESTQTLEFLSEYGGGHFLNSQIPKPETPLFSKNRKIIFCLGLDPLNPKLYVACGVKSYAGSGNKFNYLYEFNISEISSLIYNGDIAIQDMNHVPNDMEVYQDKLWIALLGASADARAFNGYNLYPDQLVEERTYTKSCNPLDPSRCSLEQFVGFLDIIEENGLVVGSTGMSTDYPEKHNIFLFNANAPAGQNLPLASSESMDWAMDIAGVGDKIHIADEWVAVHSLNYNYNGQNASIQHHLDPNEWEDPTRIFSPGWHSYGLWEHNRRIYSGKVTLTSMDAYSLGNFREWKQWSGVPWFVFTGNHGKNSQEDYILALACQENFVMELAGMRLFLLYEDPQTKEFSLLNELDHRYFEPKVDRFYQVGLGGFSITGIGANGFTTNIQWLEDNLVFFTIPDYGLFAYYVDAPQNVLEERAVVEVEPLQASYWFGAPVQWISQTFTDVEPITIDNQLILGVTEAWAGTNSELYTPDPNWGGVHFYEVVYDDGAPPDAYHPHYRVNFNYLKDVKCLRGYRADALVTSSDGWVAARISWQNALLTERRLVIFRYQDIDDMNSRPDDQVLSEITLPLENFSPTIIQSYDFSGMPHSSGIREACFWQLDKIVVPVGSEQWDLTGHTGVFVFNRETKEQVYYYPGGRAGNQHYVPGQFSNYPDSNIQLIPNPVRAIPAANGDLLIGTSWAGQIARLGVPSADSRGPIEFSPEDIDRSGQIDITDAQICIAVIQGNTIGLSNDIIERAKAVAAPTDEVDILDLTAIINEILGE